MTGALVHRVVIRDGRAVGVEYERKGRRVVAGANREVILSAGAYGTPQAAQQDVTNKATPGRRSTD